ncbi:PIN domain-containing protein [Halosimplex rubrum]|uniref:PIN domain-containing protein n=1 Tax=Halosimplex rubrum TaxID=869889 RepID=A0A7D5TQD1_9EURY|nr:PIN domain-containing protein [Halosimplex rubrum]QLH78754.1 PIN domain-containing protein [Halosimplex rubrum]
MWLEFVFDGDSADEAESVIERANSPDVGGLVAPTVVSEVSYRVRRVEDEGTARAAIRAIRDFDHVESMPVVDDIGEYAAELRSEYYEPGDRELSYADAIHLATAVVHGDCDTLYTGDPDFEGIEEIETVVL